LIFIFLQTYINYTVFPFFIHLFNFKFTGPLLPGLVIQFSKVQRYVSKGYRAYGKFIDNSELKIISSCDQWAPMHSLFRQVNSVTLWDIFGHSNPRIDLSSYRIRMDLIRIHQLVLLWLYTLLSSPSPPLHPSPSPPLPSSPSPLLPSPLLPSPLLSPPLPSPPLPSLLSPPFSRYFRLIVAGVDLAQQYSFRVGVVTLSVTFICPTLEQTERQKTEGGIQRRLKVG
jgi:hypothetical protein